MPTIVSQELFSEHIPAIKLISGSSKIKACIEHWKEGKSWEDTGIYDFTMKSIEKTGKPVGGCTTFEEVVEKYEALDRIFDFVSGGGKIHSNFGNDSIIHIGPNGDFLFGGGAHHRTAIAHILEVDIPVRPFLIHEDQKSAFAKLALRIANEKNS